MKKRRPVPARKPARPEGMPEGAVMSNPARITPGGWGPVPLWYEDITFSCRDCRKKEVWTAGQQKWWYEVAGGILYRTAVRCRDCRKARRLAEVMQKPLHAVNAARIAEARQQRAQKKAVALVARLAAQGPAAFDILELPAKDLGLDKRTERILTEQGLHTIGDLVAHDSAHGIAGLYPDDVLWIRKLLENAGLVMVGTPVSRP